MLMNNVYETNNLTAMKIHNNQFEFGLYEETIIPPLSAPFTSWLHSVCP